MVLAMISITITRVALYGFALVVLGGSTVVAAPAFAEEPTKDVEVCAGTVVNVATDMSGNTLTPIQQQTMLRHAKIRCENPGLTRGGFDESGAPLFQVQGHEIPGVGYLAANLVLRGRAN